MSLVILLHRQHNIIM